MHHWSYDASITRIEVFRKVVSCSGDQEGQDCAPITVYAQILTWLRPFLVHLPFVPVWSSAIYIVWTDEFQLANIIGKFLTVGVIPLRSPELACRKLSSCIDSARNLYSLWHATFQGVHEIIIWETIPKFMSVLVFSFCGWPLDIVHTRTLSSYEDSSIPVFSRLDSASASLRFSPTR